MAAKIDFNLIVSLLTTVYNKQTHQARQQVTTKITISIIDEYNGHVFLVHKRTVSSKHFLSYSTGTIKFFIITPGSAILEF